MRFLASRGSPCTVCSERNRREPVLGSKTLLHQNAGSTRQPTLRGPEPSPFLVRRTSRPFAPPSSPFLDDFTKKRRKKKEKKRPTRVRIAGGLGDRGRLTGYAVQAVDPLLLIGLYRGAGQKRYRFSLKSGELSSWYEFERGLSCKSAVAAENEQFWSRLFVCRSFFCCCSPRNPPQSASS